MVGIENHLFRVLIPQQDMTGADRRWAAGYNVDVVLRYSRGSKVLGIGAGNRTLYDVNYRGRNLLWN